MTLPPATAARLEALRRGDLAGIRELRLPGGPEGRLSEMPPEILGLADTLELLDLGQNDLTALPADLGRLRRLRVLFCSGNRFDRLPPVLGDCTALSQVGFRGSGIAEVPAESLSPALRWLTLTDNRIAALPASLGDRPLLQKLMLAGNRLRALPESLRDAQNLELLRIAANGFEALPACLTALPRLAWLSWAGNPFEDRAAPSAVAAIPVAWRDLTIGPLLGEGASGRVMRAAWRPEGTGEARPVALKLFKGAMTSDGLPEREMAACLAAGAHPHLTGGLGRLADHPDGTQGLLMPLLPEGWRVLAGPPSLESCSRDVYEPGLRLTQAASLRLARGVASGAVHLHASGFGHGDLYAHNVLWDGTHGEAVLSDLGAASALPSGPEGEVLQRLDVRAFGLLLEELRTIAPLAHPAAEALAQACTGEPAARPGMAEVLGALDGLIRESGPA
ncbi:leucine-rich repeat-containing protein kinase family protein [Methylobacterium sp. SyP6R]|uniref:leucine-rich repeat-containing protein kinase family protein n=1 Tax=Methylobacterium sp. SyP6R TaxID=2718876 RepID=UPI001F201685|nr:leucine-rich repeat-containing protein kinase family protein [Methylobacterium sp. SyP6R]MCF4125138.1 leucine-rich repeat-containing serine/threonine-protein kinase [Methylobacterium sp. SyP6R]